MGSAQRWSLPKLQGRARAFARLTANACLAQVPLLCDTQASRARSRPACDVYRFSARYSDKFIIQHQGEQHKILVILNLINYVLLHTNKLDLIKCNFNYEGSWYKSVDD